MPDFEHGNAVNVTTEIEQLEICGSTFSVSRPHSFGLVINGLSTDSDEKSQLDYLHEVLLANAGRDEFLDLIDAEGLVVCKNVHTEAPTYRKVRGKSSHGKLSQAEYYHHDGCSCPTKPRVVEIRMPYQIIDRNVHTAVAHFPEVVKAMLMALPKRLLADQELLEFHDSFSGDLKDFPPVEAWDKIQGRVTRLVRREMNAESCRLYFREVDQLANAYVLPWEMGESRLMVNHADNLAKTMQHRRAYQKPREANEQNGSLVKRWTAEEA